jgi:hypothetical protein
VAKGWSQKALIRTIVLSATYRQSSAIPPALAERDPYNRLLARGPRVRLEAEMVRDSALAASGLLSLKMFGPSVFPLQPDGIWNMPYNSDKWVTSSGDDRYRRSLYTFWRRTSPYPSFMTFDATSREYCTVRRVRTNTPLQALTQLNDPASFEAAGALARRMMAAGTTARARAAFGVKLVLSRESGAPELDRLVALYERELAHYGSQGTAPGGPSAAPPSGPAAAPPSGPSAAPASGPTAPPPDGPEPDSAAVAAWTIVANVLLNLDEAVTKE